jgi:hypothetical protein
MIASKDENLGEQLDLIFSQMLKNINESMKTENVLTILELNFIT